MAKAVCLLSGGLDSATCLGVARRDGFECYALSFDYGQRHRVELEAAAKVAAHFGVRASLFRTGLPDRPQFLVRWWTCCSPPPMACSVPPPPSLIVWYDCTAHRTSFLFLIGSLIYTVSAWDYLDDTSAFEANFCNFLGAAVFMLDSFCYLLQWYRLRQETHRSSISVAPAMWLRCRGWHLDLLLTAHILFTLGSALYLWAGILNAFYTDEASYLRALDVNLAAAGVFVVNAAFYGLDEFYSAN